MSNITPDPIMKTALGFMAAKHLFVANEIGLFRALAEEPATLDELAGRTGVPRRTLRIVADAMVSLGFLDRRKNHYQNSEVVAAFLSGRGVRDLGPALRHLDRISYRFWLNLEEAVRSGQAQAQIASLSDEEQQVFSQGVAAFTAPTAAALAAGYDFGGHRHVLDLGGGTGSFLVAILGRYAELSGTLFELPGAAAVARRYLAGRPEAARIKVVEGDFFEGSLPEGADAVILANVIHVFSPVRNLDLLRRTRRRVSERARLLLVDFWTDPTHTQPPAAPLMAGEFLLWGGEGDVYSVEEARGWLQETGWLHLEHKPLAGPTSVIVAEAV
jgi:SAM-dependent methyltransferase